MGRIFGISKWRMIETTHLNILFSRTLPGRKWSTDMEYPNELFLSRGKRLRFSI